MQISVLRPSPEGSARPQKITAQIMTRRGQSDPDSSLNDNNPERDH